MLHYSPEKQINTTPVEESIDFIRKETSRMVDDLSSFLARNDLVLRVGAVDLNDTGVKYACNIRLGNEDSSVDIDYVEASSTSYNDKRKAVRVFNGDNDPFSSRVFPIDPEKRTFYPKKVQIDEDVERLVYGLLSRAHKYAEPSIEQFKRGQKVGLLFGGLLSNK